MAVPEIGYDDLVGGAPGGRARAAQAIREGFGRLGLVYVRGTPVTRTEVEAFYDAFLAVLARPAAEKAACAVPELWFQRGYTPPNTEVAVASGGTPDFKECWFSGPSAPAPEDARAWPELFATNVWPADADAFRQGMLGLGAKLQGVGEALLGAAEDALGAPAGSLGAVTRGAAHVTRALKYLPLDAAQVAQRQKVLWGEEHTDFNLLTLLPGGRFYRDGVADVRPRDGGGLFLRTRDGAKVPGRPPPDCLVVQVGQQLEILSGGIYVATPHGIVAPDEPGFTRTSLAHFVHVHPRAVLEPLPACRAAAGGKYDPPVLAGTYATKTLVDIGLAPRSALERLGYRARSGA